jgi:hypothetical protein
MSEAIFARVRGQPEPLPPLDENDPWSAVERLFGFVFERLDADDKRFASLEARRASAHGRDGVGIIDARIDDGGSLILEFSDGTQKNVGRVVGRDAPPAPAPKSLEFVRDETGRVVRSVLR